MSNSEIEAIGHAIVTGAPADELAALPLPATARGALVKADEVEMFAGLESAEKAPANPPTWSSSRCPSSRPTRRTWQ